jgi:hypothetical protein
MRGFRIAAAAAFVSSFVSFVVLVSAPASAETKSWTAAKNIAPDQATIVLSVDMTQVQKSTIYQQMVPALIAAEDDAKEGVDAIKSACGIDALTAVTDVTVIMDDPDSGSDEGIVVLGVNGINEAKAVSCLKKIAKKEKKVLTAKKAGKITELSIKGESDKIYMAWLAKDVVAFAVEPDDKALLTKWIGGKGLSAGLTATLAKVDMTAAGWLVANKSEELEPGVKMMGAYGSVKIAAGTISGEVNLVVDSAKAAKKMAADAKKQLAEGAKQMPANIAKLLNGVTITSADTTLTVKASVAESDAMAIMGLLQAF